MQTTQDMLKALLDNNINVFASSFDDSVKDIISDRLQDKQIDMSQDILKSTDIETSEQQVKEGYGRIGSDSYKFDNPKDLEKLVQSAIKAGIPKKSLVIKGNVLHVKDLADSDMEELLYFLSKEMGAEDVDESINIINTLQEAVIGENRINFVFKNGDYRTINISEAKDIIKIHDSLVRYNQVKMRTQLEESSDSFGKMIEFSKKALRRKY